MIGRAYRIVGALALLMLPACAGAATGQVNLAAAREGAQVVASSSAQGRQFAADNLIDGDPGTSWATADGKVEKQWAIVRLAGARAPEIGAIALDNTPTHGHPPEAGVRNFELAAATAGRDDADFGRIDLFSCRMSGGRQVFTFPPVRAKFIKLTLKGNYGYPSFIEVNELEVFAVGESPAVRTASPEVLLCTNSADVAGGPFGALAKSLAQVGAQVTAFPGGKASARLTASDLLGIGVVIASGEMKSSKDDVEALERFCRRGGGLVIALPPDPSPLAPLLTALGVSVGTAPAAGAASELSPHWITEGLAPALTLGNAHGLVLAGSTPLIRQGGATVALAGAVDKGRVVVAPIELLTGGAETADGAPPAQLELARRAVLWAAGMEEAPPPAPPAPIRLAGCAVVLNEPTGAAKGPEFGRLEAALTERGLHLAEARVTAGEFKRGDLGEASLLIAFMPSFGASQARDLTDWVNAGGALLVLGDPTAPAAELMAVNRFLREFGVAIASAPAKKLTVALGRHPATVGIDMLSRSGDMLGVWAFQGTTLAKMAETPVAVARTIGRGRVVVMDAGFAMDPVEPSPDQQKPPPPSGIQLAQNEQFVVQCVAWLLGCLGNGS